MANPTTNPHDHQGPVTVAVVLLVAFLAVALLLALTASPWLALVAAQLAAMVGLVYAALTVRAAQAANTTSRLELDETINAAVDVFRGERRPDGDR